MTDLVFFYGTLMSGFQRPGRAPLDRVLVPIGRGWINAALFDLGIYPAAIPATDTRVETHVTLPDGLPVKAWVYFYNAPLGRAERIESGDYFEHLGVR